MRRIIPLLLLLIMTGIGAGVSAEQEDELNALDYLPPGYFIAGWEATGNEILARPQRAGYLIGEELPLLGEYDLVWYAAETYARGEDEMRIEIFEFPSGSDAFGYYGLSYIEPAEPTPIEVIRRYDLPPPPEIETIRRVMHGDSEWLEGYQDRFYFRVRVTEEELPQSGIQAGLYLLARLPGMAVPADMIGLLPHDNLVRGTERYIRGPIGLDLLLHWNEDDVFGFDEYPWKAVGGEYRLGGGKYYFLIIARYEDADVCEIAARRLQEHFQDLRWQTVIVPPMQCGAHPRAFHGSPGEPRDDMFTAFWPDGTRLWLLWDLIDREALTTALAQHGD